MAQLSKQLEEKKALDAAEEAKKTQFNEDINMSQDLYDNLQDLLDHTALEAGATAGYLGKVVYPIKGFKDGLSEHADEDAHIIEGSEQHIEW